MKKSNSKTIKNATPIVAHTTTERKTERTFDTLKRDTEKALAIGGDVAAAALVEFGRAMAALAVAKYADPQRKTAVNRDTVSDNGMNPMMQILRREIFADVAALDNLQSAVNAALAIKFTEDGDALTDIVDKKAWERSNILSRERLGDGMDLVQDVILAILEEQAAGHDTAADWLDTPYTVRKLDKRVLIKDTDSAAYHDEEVTPSQAAFRNVGYAIRKSRAMQVDPRNGYTYLSELTEDGLDTVYRRLGKYSDLSGYACNGQLSDVAGAPAGWYSGDGLCTADMQTADDMAELVARFELTDRQATVLKYRMQGYGIKAIATRLGVSHQAIAKTLEGIGKKADGIMPDGAKKAREKVAAEKAREAARQAAKKARQAKESKK